MESYKWFLIGMGVLILLIIVAIVLGVTLGGKSKNVVFYDEETVPLQWWQNATIYRVYVTSFADSDGDGKGDFKGIQDHLDYLVDLGVNVLWLSPIQDTNTISGSDVIDYNTVKDEYGVLLDLTSLLNAAQELGIKVIMDIIMNQSGTVHPWFRQSLLKTDPFRDYYIWNPGRKNIITGQTSPPNNWVSIYGGSAWEWNAQRNEYYLHQFWKNEPDLNFRKTEIIQEMNKAVNFWLKQGVDGFFLRDTAFWFEDSQLRDDNQIGNSDNYLSFNHNYTRDLIESYQAVTDVFLNTIGPKLGVDKILLIQSNDRVLTDDKSAQIYQLVTSKALYHLPSTFTGNELRNAVQQTLESFNRTRVWPAWTLGDEERSRIMTKFDQLSVGLQVVQLLLPGCYSIYYGEEIQMKDNPMISFDQTMDNVALAAGAQNYTRLSRDPYHSPMLWNSSRNSGFSSAQSTWLPVYSSGQTVDLMKSRSNSLWNTIKELTILRKSSLALTNGTIEYPLADNDIFSFTRIHEKSRIGYLVVWNIGNQRKTLTFDNATYIPHELTVLRKIKPEGSRTETSVVKKNDVGVEARELILFSFQK